MKCQVCILFCRIYILFLLSGKELSFKYSVYLQERFVYLMETCEGRETVLNSLYGIE